VNRRYDIDALAEAFRPLVAGLVAEELDRRERAQAPVEWLTTDEYAERMRTTPAAVRQRCLRDQVPGAVKDGAHWLIPVAATLPSDNAHTWGERRANGPAPGTRGRTSHAR
jgi:hypothetical protein